VTTPGAPRGILRIGLPRWHAALAPDEGHFFPPAACTRSSPACSPAARRTWKGTVQAHDRAAGTRPERRLDDLGDGFTITGRVRSAGGCRALEGIPVQV
jgi:hypothetical protein